MSEKIFKYHELLKLSPGQLVDALENPQQLEAVCKEFFSDLIEYELKILFGNFHLMTAIGGCAFICRLIGDLF